MQPPCLREETGLGREEGPEWGLETRVLEEAGEKEGRGKGRGGKSWGRLYPPPPGSWHHPSPTRLIPGSQAPAEDPRPTVCGAGGGGGRGPLESPVSPTLQAEKPQTPGPTWLGF